jgi:purine-binding chemotaxis protein CheW
MTATVASAASTDEVVTFRVGSQWFGIHVLEVQEVMVQQRIARVPLAAPGVAGLLNLRGQIVTAIDLYQRLEISPGTSEPLMNVVVRNGDELFALIVDEVGDVTVIPSHAIRRLPANLAGAWARICTGVVEMDHGVLAIVDVTHLLDESNTCP